MFLTEIMKFAPFARALFVYASCWRYNANKSIIANDFNLKSPNSVYLRIILYTYATFMGNFAGKVQFNFNFLCFKLIFRLVNFVF